MPDMSSVIQNSPFYMQFVSEVFEHNSGGQIVFRFPNGHGVSVVRHSMSFGHVAGLFEIATLNVDGNIVPIEGITNDFGVQGWLSPEEVVNVLEQVYAL